VPDLAERDVYVCGPEDWIETVRRVAQAAGLPADQLHIEKFRW
jgi:ferredoxin-NADP reductase